MATTKSFTPESNSSLINKWVPSESLGRIMFRFTNFLVSIYMSLLNALCFMAKYLNRSRGNHGCEENSATHSQKDNHFVSQFEELCSGSQAKEGKDFSAETEDSVSLKTGLITCTSKYQFMADKNVSGFIEEPKAVSFTVEEVFLGPNESMACCDQSPACWDFQSLVQHLRKLDDKCSLDSSSAGSESDFSSSFASNEYMLGFVSEEEIVDQEKEVSPFENCLSKEVLGEEEETSASNECKVLGDKEVAAFEEKFLEDQDFAYEIELLPENQILASGSQQEYETSEIACHVASPNDSNERKLDEAMDRMEEPHHDDMSLGNGDSVVITEKELGHIDDEYIELEPHMVRSEDTETCSTGDNNGEAEKSSDMSNDIPEKDELGSPRDDGKIIADGLKDDCPNDKTWDLDFDDEDETSNVLLEHQQLVEQMKMELKRSRVIKLPTILEECEPPKMEFEPLTIDHKFEYKDVLQEIQNFYKSYAEKMRKLDILNYQTLQAISFLQLKDSEIFSSGKKNAITLSLKSSFNLPKIWPPCKLQRIYADPTSKSIKEMHRDLELVYVGQLCLSWEIVRWQFGKTKELHEYDDSQGSHSYNRVTEEFQQFQVLVQRFMEDEPFQGPRLQNYVKNRCTIRSFLQVPMIKDDYLRDKKERKVEQDAVSLEMLMDIIKETMRTFWEFLHADKHATKVTSKGVPGTRVDLQNPADTEFLMEIITSLQKKERRLREIIRSQNCLVKKLQQKHQDCRLNHTLLTCQVELRLVSRVLSLSRLTRDQLVWCQNKVNNINFMSRNVQVDPCFALFPC